MCHAWGVAVLPILPLQSVLLPGMPTVLRIFEPRYRVMFERVLEGEGEFGVVLIERGPEVGGGDRRFARGTLARVSQSREMEDGTLAVVATGGPRFEVVRWYDDDPHPEALVRWLPALEWFEELRPDLDHTERVVRRILAVASEFGVEAWPANVELDDDPLLRAWQLAGVAPLGPLDHLALLGAESLVGLLERTVEFTEAAEETLALATDLDFPFDDEG